MAHIGCGVAQIGRGVAQLGCGVAQIHCPKTLESKIMLLELMLYRMYTCVLLDIKNLYSLYKNLLCCI
jgi:hypothetical protein